MTDIPDGITSEHILKAITDFETGVPHEFVDSTAYDLLHEGKRYPPKAILGLAAKQILGEPLKPSDFSGGVKSKCFRVLEDAGFEIVEKRKAEAWMLQGNPDYFDIDRYLRDFDYVYWSVPRAHHRAEMRVGDPVFFWRAKGKSKTIAGVVATGVIAESCTDEDAVRFPELIDPDVSTDRGKQWNEDQGHKGRIKVGVRVTETRLSPDDGMLTRDGLLMDPVLSQLKAIKVAVSRISRVSGMELQDLSGLWKGVRELTEEHGHSEGSMTRAISIRYERSKSARDACLDSWGYDCQGCGINFEDRYGSIGKEFIHVHHRKPLSEIGEAYEVNPIKDLIPLCPNCHAMVHRKNPPLEIEQLQELLEQKQKVKLEQLQEIIQRFDDHQRLVDRPSRNDVEVEIVSEPDRMLAARLDRAVMNQVENGQATLSRYAIWADTMRDLIRRSLKELEQESGFDCSKSSLTQSANSLSAFSEIQAHFDPFTGK